MQRACPSRRNTPLRRARPPFQSSRNSFSRFERGGLYMQHFFTTKKKECPDALTTGEGILPFREMSDPGESPPKCSLRARVRPLALRIFIYARRAPCSRSQITQSTVLETHRQFFEACRLRFQQCHRCQGQKFCPRGVHFRQLGLNFRTVPSFVYRLYPVGLIKLGLLQLFQPDSPLFVYPPCFFVPLLRKYLYDPYFLYLDFHRLSPRLLPNLIKQEPIFGIAHFDEVVHISIFERTPEVKAI